MRSVGKQKRRIWQAEADNKKNEYDSFCFPLMVSRGNQRRGRSLESKNITIGVLWEPLFQYIYSKFSFKSGNINKLL